MKKLTSWIFIFILILFVGAFFLFLNSVNKPKIPQKTEEETTTLDLKKLERLNVLKHPGEPVNLQEPGFGRPNPFAPY